jgi:predicted nucleic-acid-binding protein
VIALDTSVLARFILRDSPAEVELANRFIAENQCSVSWSVLVELCWVLESSAGLPRDEAASGLAAIARIANITVPSAELLEWAIERYAKGADFADMVHLATSSVGSSGFATFDRKLARQAGPQAPIQVQTLRT